MHDGLQLSWSMMLQQFIVREALTEMQTHCQESLNPEAPKAGSANELKPLLRFGEVDNKERNQTRCRRLDKKYIINH